MFEVGIIFLKSGNIKNVLMIVPSDNPNNPIDPIARPKDPKSPDRGRTPDRPTVRWAPHRGRTSDRSMDPAKLTSQAKTEDNCELENNSTRIIKRRVAEFHISA